MGLTHVTTIIKPIQDGGLSYEADFLVDTGATDCLVPKGELKKIGIVPVGKSKYELIDGTPQEFEWGVGMIEFMGDITASRIIFGPDNAEPILGVLALESLGIMVDPVNKTLKRLPAIPLKRIKWMK